MRNQNTPTSKNKPIAKASIKISWELKAETQKKNWIDGNPTNHTINRKWGYFFMGNYKVMPYRNHYIVVNEKTNEIECHVDTYREGLDEIKVILLSEQ